MKCMSRTITPDGRYLVVRGRLWRMADPHLPGQVRTQLVEELMEARRDIRKPRCEADAARLAKARERVDAAKIALGERGPPWWDDGAKDFNRHLVKNTPYAEWYAELSVMDDDDD
jgi:hypothetical protein